MKQENDNESIIKDVLEITGLNNKESIIPYLQQKRTQLLTDNNCINCIGNVQLPLREYQEKGVIGFLQYVRESFLKNLPIIPIAFPVQYYEDVIYLSENNINFKIKPFGLNMNFVLARSDFWKIFINSALVNLFASQSYEIDQVSQFIEENDWNKLKVILEKIWNHKNTQELKKITLKNSKLYKPSNYTNFNLKRKIELVDPQENKIQDVLNKDEQIWSLFTRNDSFEENIWKPICYYFINPYQNVKSKSIGGDRDNRVLNSSLLNKINTIINIDDDN